MSDLIILGVKLCLFSGLYLLRQRLCNKKIRLEHIVITLILALYTKPIIEDAFIGLVKSII